MSLTEQQLHFVDSTFISLSRGAMETKEQHGNYIPQISLLGSGPSVTPIVLQDKKIIEPPTSNLLIPKVIRSQSEVLKKRNEELLAVFFMLDIVLSFSGKDMDSIMCIYATADKTSVTQFPYYVKDERYTWLPPVQPEIDKCVLDVIDIKTIFPRY